MTDGQKISSGIVALALAPFLVALEGFVLSRLWAWFAAPTFGLPVLSVVQAAGLALVIGLATYRRIPSDEGALIRMFDSAATCLLFWGAGAIVAQFL